MSESDDDDRLDLRRQAVDELKEEILASLGRIEAFTRSAQLVGAVEMVVREDAPDAEGVVSMETLNTAKFVALIERLLWLLALCEQERAFVQATMDVVLDAGRAWGELSVFADWLEENLRLDDATLVRRLVPQDGDVLTFIVRGDLTARERRVARGCIQSAINRLRSRGADVGCLVLGDGLDLAFLDEDKMADQGWVRAGALDVLHGVVAGQPEGEGEVVGGWVLVRQAAAVAGRLKDENAQLREQNNQLSAFLAQEGYPPLAALSDVENPQETQP